MKYITANNYLCFLCLLEMIIKDATNKDISQFELAEKFGIIIPYEYIISVKNIKYSNKPNEYGIHTDENQLNNYFINNNINLEVSYIAVNKINEIEFDNKLNKLLYNDEYIICTYSYGSLFHKDNLLDIGHVALLEDIIDNDKLKIYDPGPDESGIKLVNLFNMYDAMRRKNGGLYILKKIIENR